MNDILKAYLFFLALIFIVIMLVVMAYTPANAMMCGQKECPSYIPPNPYNFTIMGNPISDDPYTNLFAGMLGDLDRIVVEMGQLIQAENANTAELKKFCMAQVEHPRDC